VAVRKDVLLNGQKLWTTQCQKDSPVAEYPVQERKPFVWLLIPFYSLLDGLVTDRSAEKCATLFPAKVSGEFGFMEIIRFRGLPWHGLGANCTILQQKSHYPRAECSTFLGILMLFRTCWSDLPRGIDLC
jgi:hypothetical protein